MFVALEMLKLENHLISKCLLRYLASEPPCWSDTGIYIVGWLAQIKTNRAYNLHNLKSYPLHMYVRKFKIFDQCLCFFFPKGIRDKTIYVLV